METLTESVEINAPFEKLCAWIDNFEEEFVRWSPYHIECQLLTGGINKGDKVRFYEIVAGMDYDITGTITQSVRAKDHFAFTFQAKDAVITFEGKRTHTGCTFKHTESFGIPAPIIGPVLNFLIFKVFFRKQADWNIIRDDMILDNLYLSDILTEGKYPDRMPVEELKKQGRKWKE